MLKASSGSGEGLLVISLRALIQALDQKRFDESHEVFVFEAGLVAELAGAVSLPVDLGWPIDRCKVFLQKEFQLEQVQAHLGLHRVDSQRMEKHLFASHRQRDTCVEEVVKLAGMNHFIERFGRIEKARVFHFGQFLDDC